MGGRARDYQTIGEVVESLSTAYPDLTVSKIRFLEEEGLISPERTAGGYRKFRPADTARIELVLRMQSEHFLPLAVIREKLADFDKGRIPEELRPIAASLESPTLPLEESGTISLEQAEKDIGLPAVFVRELIEFGLVEPVATDGVPELTRSDIEIAHTCWDLRRFGIEPRHLKMFDAFADREAGLLEQVLMPSMRSRTPEARQKVVRQLGELTGLTDDLKRHLLRRALSDSFEDVT